MLNVADQLSIAVPKVFKRSFKGYLFLAKNSGRSISETCRAETKLEWTE